MSELNIEDIEKIMKDSTEKLGVQIKYPDYSKRDGKLGGKRFSEQEIKQAFVLKFYEYLNENKIADKYYLTFETPTKYAYAFHLKENDCAAQPECDKTREKSNFQSGQIDVSIWKNDNGKIAYSHIEFKHIPKTDNIKPVNRKKITKDLLKLSMEESASGTNYFVFVINNDNKTWNSLKALLFDKSSYNYPKDKDSIYDTIQNGLGTRYIKIIVFDREKGKHLGTFDYAYTLSDPDGFINNKKHDC